MEIKSKIEALLFVSSRPLGLKQLSDAVKIKPAEAEKACEELSREYREAERGMEIIRQGNKFQMVSSPEAAELVRRFVKSDASGELSRPSLETLTIIAYRGPIAKIDLDRIRGVNCALIIRNLLIRGLIEGKDDRQKRETYYSVTIDFIRFLGLNEISELPDYGRLHAEETLEKMLEK